MIFGRTDLRTGVSEAKFDGEADFEVRSDVATQKPCEKLISRSKNRVEKFCQRQNVFVGRESFEMRFGKVSRRSEPSSWGKRPFKIFAF